MVNKFASLESLAAAIDQSPFAKFRDDLVRLAVPCVAATATPGPVALGKSRLGGAPDAPESFRWPVRENRPMAFLCQISFADIPDGPARAELPDAGGFLLFYDTTEQPWGFDPADRSGWHVENLDAAAKLSRQTAPAGLASDSSFAECALQFGWEWSLPTGMDDLPAAMGSMLSDDESCEAWFEDFRKEGTAHQLLGYPRLNQGDMRAECQLASSGVYCGRDPSSDPRTAALLSGASNLRLLLQIDTDEDAPGWMWGDCGTLYYMIRNSDLRDRRFDQGWLILQCY